jgi:hypothetical protein
VKPSIRCSALLMISLMCCLLFVPYAFAQATNHKPGPVSSPDTSEVSSESPIGDVSPTTLDFGAVLVNQTSPQKRVRLTNTGDSKLIVSNISITGPFALPVNKCANGVNPGSHCDVYLTFTPSDLGTQTGTLTFTDNASNSPQTVSLTGVGAATVPTATSITASPTTFYAGQPVTLQATVVSLGGGLIPDGDQVAFLFPTHGGRNLLGYGTLQKGVATITTTGVFWTDNPRVEAQYVGDPSFYPSEGVVHVDVLRYGPTISLTPVPDPSVYRQPVTVTARLTSASPLPIGGHIFIGGLCGDIEYSVVNGVATQVCKSPAKGAGTYQLFAYYKGDSYNGPGNASATQVIDPTSTTTSLTSSKNPSEQGQSVKFVAKVRAPYAHPVIGSITFTSGADVLGTVDLVSSTASIIVSSLPPGQNTITATYNPGSANFLGSSASLVQVVK